MNSRHPAWGRGHGGLHYTLAAPNAPWWEMFMPPPGGPPEVYRRFEEDNGKSPAALRAFTCVRPTGPDSAGT